MYIYIYIFSRKSKELEFNLHVSEEGAEEFINLRRSYPISALSVSPSPNIRSFNYQHSWYRSQFPSLPKCIDVASSRALHIHGILACSVSVFSLFAYSISTSSSSPEDFLKSSYLLVVVIFFFFVRQRPESNKPATKKGERGRERERGKERD